MRLCTVSLVLWPGVLEIGLKRMCKSLCNFTINLLI